MLASVSWETGVVEEGCRQSPRHRAHLEGDNELLLAGGLAGWMRREGRSCSPVLLARRSLDAGVNGDVFPVLG